MAHVRGRQGPADRLGVPVRDAVRPVQEFGFRLHVLPPGQPNGLYHSEQAQEDFLVLSGECTLLVEGEERTLRAWDFFHAPAGTEHIFVGAGEEPCVILMAGSRPADEQLRYPVSELAARYGASARARDDRPGRGLRGLRARPLRAARVLGQLPLEHAEGPPSPN